MGNGVNGVPGGFGGFGIDWSNMWNSGFGNFGGGFGSAWGCGFPGAVGDCWSGSGSSSSGKTKEERLANKKLQREIESIRDLLRGLVKDENILTTAERDSLEDDLSHLPSKREEKLEELKKLYNKYKDTIKANLGRLGIDKDGKPTGIAKDFAAIGYESETDLDDKIGDLSTALAEKGDNDISSTINDFKKVEILDLLSSWNSNSANSKKLMDTIIEAYNDLPITQEEGKSPIPVANRALLESYAKELKSSLAKKAGELANNAMLKDDTLKGQLKTLKSNLEGMDFKYCADTFNELYKTCRIAGAKVMENTYKEQYEFLGSDNLFGNIVDETIADLKAEGLNETVDIENIKSVDDAKKEALKKHTDITILDSCGKCQTGDNDRVAFYNKNDKITQQGVGKDYNLKELYEKDAIMDVSYSPDNDNGRWDKNGKENVRSNLNSILSGITSTLAAAGLDSKKLAAAQEKVLNAYITRGCREFQDDKSDKSHRDGDRQDKKGYSLEHIVRFLDSDEHNSGDADYTTLGSVRNKIIDVHDDDGNNTHLFIVRVKDLVDDILEEYNKTAATS